MSLQGYTTTFNPLNVLKKINFIFLLSTKIYARGKQTQFFSLDRIHGRDRAFSYIVDKEKKKAFASRTACHQFVVRETYFFFIHSFLIYFQLKKRYSLLDFNLSLRLKLKLQEQNPS